MFNNDWPCHLATFLHHHYYKGDQVTKPIVDVKICYKLLYVIQVVKKIFDKYCNFLVSTDIKAFGRTYLFTMLLLIGFALLLHLV